MATGQKIRVLLADDSALMRRELTRIITSDPGLEVIAAARNGREACELVRNLRPDVVTLDINMPEMDGLTALSHIMAEAPCPVVMISSLTQEGAVTTYEALDRGAVDFVGKPDGTISRNLASVAREVTGKIRAAAQVNRKKLGAPRVKNPQPPPQWQRPAPKVALSAGAPPCVVVIGQSTGGPNAIAQILRHLPEDFPAALVVVQHMPASFTPSFSRRLDYSSPIRFSEAAHSQRLEGGCGYVAPGDRQLTITASSRPVFRVSVHPSTPYMPSVNLTMESAVQVFGSRTIGVLLTGMGDDGANGMVAVRQAGGRTIAESEETAVVFGMPREAIRRGGAEVVLPCHAIGRKIVELVRTMVAPPAASKPAVGLPPAGSRPPLTVKPVGNKAKTGPGSASPALEVRRWR
jgi:two-component system chemotaxis response regulator CheB